MSFIGNTPAESYSTVVKDTFSGNDSTTAFTLSIPATTNSVEVLVENVQQEPTTAYSISGTTLTFTAAPVTGTNNIYVIHRGPAVQQVTPPAGVAIDASTITGTGDMNIDSGTLFVDASTNRVGIGTSSPSSTITIANNGTIEMLGGSSTLKFNREDTTTIAGNPLGAIEFSHIDSDDAGVAAKILGEGDGGSGEGRITLHTGTPSALVEAMRIDSSGNLLVGTTDTNPTNDSDTSFAFVVNKDNHEVRIRSHNLNSLEINRTGTDGSMATFTKDGASEGGIYIWSINSAGQIVLGSGNTGLALNDSIDSIHPFNAVTGGNRDNSVDIGSSVNRFDDVYATNATIQTSDRNEKQDIEQLTEAEQRVAVAAKSLMRKFRWKSAVEKKGDDARIHFGIIAQDLQAAFEAEGLDAGRYAMFISSTWWETQTEVEAVAEEVDEEGNVITEAKEAYIRTDTYETAEEAPEGAVERTRLGVRYPELLAFIIGAL